MVRPLFWHSVLLTYSRFEIEMHHPPYFSITRFDQNQVGQIRFIFIEYFCVNCYVFGYADYGNQYEKNIKNTLGGGKRPPKLEHFHFLSKGDLGRLSK